MNKKNRYTIENDLFEYVAMEFENLRPNTFHQWYKL